MANFSDRALKFRVNFFVDHETTVVTDMGEISNFFQEVQKEDPELSVGVMNAIQRIVNAINEGSEDISEESIGNCVNMLISERKDFKYSRSFQKLIPTLSLCTVRTDLLIPIVFCTSILLFVSIFTFSRILV